MKLLYHVKCESSLELNKWSQRPWTLVPGPICRFSCCFLDSWFHCLWILFIPPKPWVIWRHRHITNAPYIVLLFSRSVVSDSLRPHGLQKARLPCPLPPPGACSLMFIESMMLSNHLILCRTVLILVNFPFFLIPQKLKLHHLEFILFLKKFLSEKHWPVINLSSLTSDHTYAPCIGSMES